MALVQRTGKAVRKFARRFLGVSCSSTVTGETHRDCCAARLSSRFSYVEHYLPEYTRKYIRPKADADSDSTRAIF